MNKIDNSNDNDPVRARYKGTDCKGSMERLVQYVPAARQLIQKYCPQYWKNLPYHTEYAFLEYQLCTLLEIKERNSIDRTYKIDMIAGVLETHPLVLCNDPQLSTLVRLIFP